MVSAMQILAISIHCAYIMQIMTFIGNGLLNFFFLPGVTLCALGPLLDLRCVTPRNRHFMFSFSDGATESGQVRLLQMSCECHRE